MPLDMKEYCKVWRANNHEAVRAANKQQWLDIKLREALRPDLREKRLIKVYESMKKSFAKRKLREAENPDLRERRLQSQRKYKAKYWTPERRQAALEKRRKKIYGLEESDVRAIIAAQKQVCAICHQPFAVKSPRWPEGVIDHCHYTGQVRGVLCSPCNLILGHAKDNPDVIENAALYLRINQ